MKRYSFMVLTLTLLALCGCTSVYRAAYGVAVEERSSETIASDKKITLSIQEKFMGDDAIKALGITPFCYYGQVYLVGQYGSEIEKTRALGIANKIPGVKSVTPYLLPKKEKDTCGTTDNIEVSTRVNAKLIGDKDIWSTNVDVKAVQCNVVLLGIVGSKKEIDKAVAQAKSVPGVRDVTSYLKAVH
jgi:hyperosmotically inducible periplasmic protein